MQHTRHFPIRAALALPSLFLLSAASAMAQVPGISGGSSTITRTGTGNPWQQALNQVFGFMVGPVAVGISSIAIVLGGLSFALGEGQNKKAIGALVFGCGMAVAAVNLLNWLI